ncbi:MAG TPA: hypothetical protein VN999_18185 [Thermoanaerobaculia bacterium]|nr:hypothetical protein [Thermoanaerobaculia bacterium]
MPAGPRLRHDFVGMMYAVAIGEVGLQAVALVKVGHPWHFLPAYSHLLLALVVIATSFVGWSASLRWVPEAQDNVPNVFSWEFLVLLLDVSLVIFYFILVRTVEFAGEGRAPSIAPAERVAFWIKVIFFLYLLWDFPTKIASGIPLRSWFGEFIVPTVVCLALAFVAGCLVNGADCSHLVTADLALLSLVLLFRALKNLGATFSRAPPKTPWIKLRKAGSSIVCGVLLLLGLLWTLRAWPLPSRLVTAIESPSPSCIEPGVEPGSPR